MDRSFRTDAAAKDHLQESFIAEDLQRLSWRTGVVLRPMLGRSTSPVHAVRCSGSHTPVTLTEKSFLTTITRFKFNFKERQLLQVRPLPYAKASRGESRVEFCDSFGFLQPHVVKASRTASGFLQITAICGHNAFSLQF